eukprot:GHVO01017513.1.p1 GENE.GHVO01017513.1~~GHVO01017513.1.p1  ORF type:complete len:252 (+),score=50.71 GHVO01017513.1:493-1248(+)
MTLAMSNMQDTVDTCIVACNSHMMKTKKVDKENVRQPQNRGVQSLRVPLKGKTVNDDKFYNTINSKISQAIGTTLVSLDKLREKTSFHSFLDRLSGDGPFPTVITPTTLSHAPNIYCKKSEIHTEPFKALGLPPSQFSRFIGTECLKSQILISSLNNDLGPPQSVDRYPICKHLNDINIVSTGAVKDKTNYTGLVHSSGIHRFFGSTITVLDRMIAKGAFLHHYTNEGIHKDDIYAARDTVLEWRAFYGGA